MLDQSFSEKNFLKLIKKNSDIGRYSIGSSSEAIKNNFEALANEISDYSFTFEQFQKFKINGIFFYRTNEYRNEFILRKMSDNFRRLYKISQADRGKIIEQTKTLLLEDTPKFIIRLDIKKFYESIDKELLYQQIFNDPLPSHQTKELLRKILLDGYFEHKKGLPRGLSISAVLSEYYLRDFDAFVKNLEGVYYYARYVDDIIIFSYKPALSINKLVKNYLSEHKKLELNTVKSQDILKVCCNCYEGCTCSNSCKCRAKCNCKPTPEQCNELDYLGYKFIFSKVPDKNSSLKITLASKKVKKIKCRIANSFIDYNKTQDIELLANRIKFLTGNYSISKGKEGNLNSGIYYNYPMIDIDDDLIALNSFLYAMIHSKNGYIGAKLKNNLTNIQRNILITNSFKFGFDSKKINKFKRNEIQKIKRIW